MVKMVPYKYNGMATQKSFSIVIKEQIPIIATVIWGSDLNAHKVIMKVL